MVAASSEQLSSSLFLLLLFHHHHVHMTRCAGGRGRGSLTESYLNPIKHEGTMAEATQETELDAELKQLRDFTSEHSVDVIHAWLKEKSKGLLPQNSVGWFRAGVGFYNMKKYYAPAIICLRTALELDPNNYNAQQVLRRAYLRVNKRQEALESLKRSVERQRRF